MNLDEIRNRIRECGECWEWISAAKSEHLKRHPQIKIGGGSPKLVRRVAWEAANGPIKDGRLIVPTCDNPYCINPDHMRAMTESQKCQEAAKRGAFSSIARAKAIADSKRRDAKLSLEIAQEIRLSDLTGAAMAEKYGVEESMIGRIRRGEAWKDYGNPFAGLMR